MILNKLGKVLLVAFALQVALTSIGSCQAAKPSNLDYVFESQNLNISFDLNHYLEVTQEAQVKVLSEMVYKIYLTSPFRYLNVASAEAGYRLENGAFAPLDFTIRILHSEGQVAINFNEPLRTYERLKVVLRYRGLSPESFVSYHDRGVEYLEFHLSLKNNVPTQGSEIVLRLPNFPSGWFINTTTPRGQTISRLFGSTTITWYLIGLSAGEKPLSVVLASGVENPYAQFPATLNLFLMGALIIGNVFYGRYRLSVVRQQKQESWIGRVVMRLISQFLHPEIFYLAVKNLNRKFGRTLLTFFGIVIPGAVVVSQLLLAVAKTSETGLFEFEPYVYALVVITLFVGFSCVISTMISSVNERRVEIGVMKAVGTSRSSVMKLFLTEASLVGLMGGMVGCLLGSVWALNQYLTLAVSGEIAVTLAFINFGLIGMIAAFYLSRSVEGFLLGAIGLFTFTAIGLYSQISFNSTFPLDSYQITLLILFSIGFTVFVSLVGGLYPAYRASKVSPMEALR